MCKYIQTALEPHTLKAKTVHRHAQVSCVYELKPLYNLQCSGEGGLRCIGQQQTICLKMTGSTPGKRLDGLSDTIKSHVKHMQHKKDKWDPLKC